MRLIKTIGDAAMFISPDPQAMIEVALNLVAAARGAGRCRACAPGSRSDPAVQRAGDYYGHTVNLASRVTGTARPGSVLATRDLRDRCAAGFDWSSAGRHRLKGVGRPVVLFRPRPL